MSVRYQYQVVPFEPKSHQAAPGELDRLIEQAGESGFEYYRMDHFVTREPPGCLGGLLGAGDTFVQHDVIVFRRRID